MLESSSQLEMLGNVCGFVLVMLLTHLLSIKKLGVHINFDL